MSTTFKQRVQWILEHRPEFHGSVSELSLAAGLSRTGLNKIIERSEDKGGPPRMRVATARNLAAQARVDQTWLETGRGLPDLSPSAVAHTDTHPLRKEAAELLQIGHGISEELAWFLMRDASVESLTVKDFYAAGVKLLTDRGLKARGTGESTQKDLPQIPESRVSSASGKMRGR